MKHILQRLASIVVVLSMCLTLGVLSVPAHASAASIATHRAVTPAFSTCGCGCGCGGIHIGIGIGIGIGL